MKLFALILLLLITITISYSQKYDEMPKYLSADESTGGRNQTIRVITTITFGNLYFDLFFLGVEATRLALNQLALQPDWLPGYKLELELVDDYCRDWHALHPIMRKLLATDNEPRRRIFERIYSDETSRSKNYFITCTFCYYDGLLAA